MGKFKVGDVALATNAAKYYRSIRDGHQYVVEDVCLDGRIVIGGRTRNPKHFDLVSKEREKMGTIREKIRSVLLSKDERLLRKHDIVSENGNLTDVGRRVLLDIIFEDKTTRGEVVARVQTVDDEEKADK